MPQLRSSLWACLIRVSALVVPPDAGCVLKVVLGDLRVVAAAPGRLLLLGDPALDLAAPVDDAATLAQGERRRPLVGRPPEPHRPRVERRGTPRTPASW